MLISQPSLHDRVGTSDALLHHNARPEPNHDPLTSPSCQRQLPANPAWLGFPVLLSPPVPTDASLQIFILDYTELRQDRLRQKLCKPMVFDLLTNDASNLLSRAVKQYLSRIGGSMELSELLASYWIISLFLRVS